MSWRMFGRRARKTADASAQRWRALAERLELRDAGDVAERIRRWLDLGSVVVDPVYLLKRPGLPAAYLFDAHTTRRGPSGEARETRRSCLLRSDEPLSAVAFRALPRQSKVLESLEAGRSGAVRVAVVSDPIFDAAVSVFARDARAALAVLVPPVREVLRRVLVTRGGRDTRLVAGERHLVVSTVVGPDESLLALEQVLADALSLVALLPSAPGSTGMEAAAGQELRVSIAPDDLLDLS